MLGEALVALGKSPLPGSVADMWLGMQSAERPGGPEPPSSSVDLPQASNFLAFFEDRLLAAHWQLAQGHHEHARMLLNGMRETFRHSDSRLIALRLDAFDATLQYHEGHRVAAARALNALVPVLEAAGLKPEAWQLLRVLAWCQDAIGATASERGRVTAAAQALLDQMTGSLSPEDQAIYNLNKWTTEEEYLAGTVDTLIAARRQAEAGFAPLRLFRRLQVARRLHALSQRIDRFKEETAGADPIRPELLLTSFTAFARDMAAHRANTCTLKFLVLPDRVVTIERSRFRLRFGVSATSRLALRHSLRAWHEWTTGLQTDGDLQANAEKAAREVGDALQIDRALAGLPARVTALRFVPDDSLHGFPFSVLKVENQYLIERFAVSVHANDAEPVRRPPAASASALFVGVTASSGDLPALTRADEELAPFRAWAGQACVTELRGGRATRRPFSARCRPARSRTSRATGSMCGTARTKRGSCSYRTRQSARS